MARDVSMSARSEDWGATNTSSPAFLARAWPLVSSLDARHPNATAGRVAGSLSTLPRAPHMRAACSANVDTAAIWFPRGPSGPRRPPTSLTPTTGDLLSFILPDCFSHRRCRTSRPGMRSEKARAGIGGGLRKLPVCRFRLMRCRTSRQDIRKGRDRQSGN